MKTMLWTVEGAKPTLAVEDDDLFDIAIIVLVETMCLQELNFESIKRIS